MNILDRAPLEAGHVAVVHGLVHEPFLNGAYVELLTDLHEREVPTARGPRMGPWHRVEVFALHRDRGDGEKVFVRPVAPITGYMRPENLMPVEYQRRSVCLHLWGTES